MHPWAWWAWALGVAAAVSMTTNPLLLLLVALGLVAVILMRAASEHLRGRVMGVRMLAIYSLPLGLLAAGSLIGEIGFVATASLYAAAGLALMLAIVLHWRADLWNVNAPANAR